MAYLNWTVGDVVKICVKVEDFCGAAPQFLYIGSADMQKYGDSCSITCIRPNCAYSCINTSNREVKFRSVLNSHSVINDVNCSNLSYDMFYRDLGSVYTDSQGIAELQYKVTEQDRINYLNAAAQGGSYDIVCCMIDSLATGAHSIVFRGVTITQFCPDQCYGTDLWGMKWDSVTGQCVQGVLKQANSPICGATHYIEYDFSILPSTFLDLVAGNIVDLSNWLGTHLPIPGNIQWKAAEYSSGKFRIYIVYTEPSAIAGMALPEMTLSTFTGMIAGLIVFVVAQRLTSVAGPVYSTIIGAALGVIAWASLSYTIYSFITNSSTTGTEPKTASVDKSKAVDEYITNYVIPFCNSQYPGCAVVPATCDQPTYRVYAACIQKIAQCQYDASLHGDPVTTCDPRIQEYKAIDTGLANGTMSVAEAQQRTTTNNTTINNYHNDVIQSMTCPSEQTYDPTTQKCVAGAEECWIPGLAGSCILSAKTGKTIAIVGGVVIGGIIIFSLIKR